MRNSEFGIRNVFFKPEPGKNERAMNRQPCHRLTYTFLPLLIALCSLPIFFPSCSSTPKKPAQILAGRNMATNQLNLANQTAGQGRYADALLILDEARRLALTTDDPVLRIKTSTSRGSILFYLGRHDEAFAEWESAAAEGDASGEPVLAAMARVYAIRARLVLLGSENPQGGNAAATAAAQYKTQIAAEMDKVKSDPVSSAACYVTLGMAEKQLGNWVDAEAAVKKALAIHDKNLYLEEAAYDWFLIASIRSVAGNYDTALDALKSAISYDRRAENGFGLASSWQAMGDVYQKAGRNEEAASARRRAADIYRAIGLEINEK